VLDSGDGVTHSVPVFEGFSMPNAIRRIDLAGRDVTDHLQLLMRGAGYDMKTSAEKEVVRGLKEEGCYVRRTSGSNSSKDDSMRPTEEFKLPDGQVIKVSDKANALARPTIC
jgi:centractin